MAQPQNPRPETSAIWLRKDRPWVYDVVRVLLFCPTGLPLQQVYREVRSLRDPLDLPKPKALEETIRDAIYEHSSDSTRFRGFAKNDLFKSPRRGTWQVRPDPALEWVRQHEEITYLHSLTGEDMQTMKAGKLVL